MGVARLYGCGPLPFERTLFVVAAAVFTSRVPRENYEAPDQESQNARAAVMAVVASKPDIVAL